MKTNLVLNWAQRQEYLWRTGCIPPGILNFGARWEWLASCHAYFSTGEEVPGTHLGGPQSRSGRGAGNRELPW